MPGARLLAIVCLGLGALAGLPAAGDSWFGGASNRSEEDEPALWRAARGAISPEPLWRYLDRYPLGLHAEGARHRLTVLGTAPGRRFDGRWSGELRCGVSLEGLRLPLAVEVENGAVHARRGAAGAADWLEASGVIGPDGSVELVGGANGGIAALHDDERAPHRVILGGLIAGAGLWARGHYGEAMCVMALSREG
jgi:hypothetical protein